MERLLGDGAVVERSVVGELEQRRAGTVCPSLVASLLSSALG